MFNVIMKDTGETFKVYDTCKGGFQLRNRGNGMEYTDDSFLVYFLDSFKWLDMSLFKPMED